MPDSGCRKSRRHSIRDPISEIRHRPTGRPGADLGEALMAIKGKHFISTQDFSPAEIEALIAQARARKHGKISTKPLAGKSVALVFFNPSLRTRTSFELAVQALGGTAVTLNAGSDTWPLVARYVDAIGVRCFPAMEKAEEDFQDAVIQAFRRHSDVPVINLESCLYHPCQALADLMTIHEKGGAVRNVKVVLTWAPHPKSLPTAVPNSLLLAATQMGCAVTLAHPPEFPLPQPV